MFATSNINYILTNAGRRACIGSAGIFYVRNDYSITLYRYPCTPVWRVNAPTAFVSECVRQRDRHGYLFYLYVCYSITHFPTQNCLSATERPPTKRAPHPHSLLPEILTPTSHAWAWTCRAATSASAARPTRRGTPLPARSTSAARATPWEPTRMRSWWSASSPNGRRSRRTAAAAVPRSGCATPSPSSPGIPMLPYCPPTSRNGRNLLLLFSPQTAFHGEPPGTGTP